MADAPKFKKPEAPAPKADPIANIIGIFILLSVVTAIIGNTFHYISQNDLTFYGLSINSFWYFLKSHLLSFKIFLFFVSGLACVGIVLISRKSGEIYAVEKAKLFPTGANAEDLDLVVPEVDTEIKIRWDKIVENSFSTNESSWRIAIIEADVILDDLLDKLNLPGDTIGDKLKAVEKSDFLTIENAWEAHKVRNQIAHGGPNFYLDQRETRRVISLYESVFKEFYLI